VLFDSLYKLVWVSHNLWYKVMFVVVFKVVYLFEVFVVLLGYILDVSEEILILQVHPPKQLIVVFLLDKHGLLVLLSGLCEGKERVRRGRLLLFGVYNIGHIDVA